MLSVDAAVSDLGEVVKRHRVDSPTSTASAVEAPAQGGGDDGTRSPARWPPASTPLRQTGRGGAVVALQSLSQLEALLAPSPSPSLRRGETAVLLLHYGESSLRLLLSGVTAAMSQVRVVTVDLAALPPRDYDRLVGGPGGASPRASGGEAGGATATAGAGVGARAKEAEGEGEDDEGAEEIPLFELPSSPSTTAGMVLSTPPSSAPKYVDGDAPPSNASLSSELQQASDVVREKISQLLRVDSILNPHLGHQTQVQRQQQLEEGLGTASATSPSASVEQLRFPAMVVWRAAGAPLDEYPPAPPQTYLSQPLPTPTTQFCDRMAASGGPLVVKEVTDIHQIHSLVLFHPVYTVQHLFRSLIHHVKQSATGSATGMRASGGGSSSSSSGGGSSRSSTCGGGVSGLHFTGSRSLLYLGASWCPPCMRFVQEAPQLLQSDLPSTVVCMLKADMDLAKPIYDFLGVEVIPTFVVMDNDVLLRCEAALNAGDDASKTDAAEQLKAMQAALTAAELGRLQNSNRRTVTTFVEKHALRLSFDEDF